MYKLQKILLLSILVACLLIPFTGDCTIDVSVSEDINDSQKLNVQYTATEGYSNAPRNIWNSQLFTIRWPEALGQGIIATASSLSVFSFGQDGDVENGGDGWFYAKFTSSSDNVVLDLQQGIAEDVFQFTFQAGVDRCLIQLVTTPNEWVDANTGRVSINNAVAGERFNSFNPASCGLVDIDPVEENFSIRIFPSPASKDVFIEMTSTHAGSGMLKIYDDAGRLMMNRVEEWTHGENSITMNIENFAAGIYLVRLGDEFDGWTGEIVKVD